MNWARPGDRLHFEFPTHNAAGAYADADSLPTATLARQGIEDLGVAVTIFRSATGLYHGFADLPTSYTPGDVVHPRVVAVIGTIPKRLLMPTVRLVGLDFGVIGDPTTASPPPPPTAVAVDDATIYRKLEFDTVPDAIPTVRVFRNGVRADTVTLSVLDSTYDVAFPVPAGWFETDYVQLVVYATFGGVDAVYELSGDTLGGRLTEGVSFASALVCDFIPDDLPTATVISDGEGQSGLIPDPTVAAGATAKEFVVSVPALNVTPGNYLCLVRAAQGGVDVSEVLWQQRVYAALAVGTARVCLTASTTHDRTCDAVGAGAIKQTAVVKTKDDVVFDFTMASAAEDITNWNISFFVTDTRGSANLTGFPKTVGNGVTITGPRSFRVTFATDPTVFVLGGPDKVFLWLAKRTDAGYRDDLASGSVLVKASEDPP